VSDSPNVQIGPYVVGEKPAPLMYQFQDSDGIPIDLTGYSAQFVYRQQYDVATTASATVSDPANGEVTYNWTGSEMTKAGHYMSEVWVGNGTNRFASVLIEFDARNAVGSVPNI
jgi:hypothetical protein